MQINKLHFFRSGKFSRDSRGQALIETTLATAVLTLLVAITCNFAYLAYLNSTTSSAARQAAIYAIQGAQAPVGSTLPAQLSDCAVATNEVNSWLAVSNSAWSASVSSAPVGSTSWTQTTGCPGGTGATAAFAADPEAAFFGNTAIAVTAQYNMPIQFSLFGIGSVANNVLQTKHTLYVRQLN